MIRVMSIHQSKGLQFPVVFLWSTDRQAALDFREPFLFDADMGIGMRYMDERRVQRPTLLASPSSIRKTVRSWKKKCASCMWPLLARRMR